MVSWYKRCNSAMLDKMHKGVIIEMSTYEDPN